MIVRRLLVVVVAAAALAGCGGRGDAVEATQKKLDDLRSFTVDLRLTAGAGSSEVGFQLEGALQPPRKDGELPVGRLRSTRLLGDRKVASTFVSDGRRAFVETAGKTLELKGRQLDSLRATTDKDADTLGGLHLDRWFEHRKQRQVGPVLNVTGSLDAPEAINDVFGLAGALGAGADQRRLTGDDANRLRRLVQRSTVELATGAKDHVLRSLRFDVRFGPGNESKVRRLLPDLGGVALHFSLSLSDVNRPVKVALPR